MKRRSIPIILTLSILSIAGIVVTQIYWIRKAYHLHERQFTQTITKVLDTVARRVAQSGDDAQVKVVPLSSAYFLVNSDVPLQSKHLKKQLETELQTNQIATDFEYGVYDTHQREVMDAGWVSTLPFEANAVPDKTFDLIIHFPNQRHFVAQQLNTWTLASTLVLLITAFLGGVLYKILAQRGHLEVQRDFIHTMTHEFQTPIAALRLATDVLALPNTASQPERMQKYLRMVQDETQRLQHQVETVLTVAHAGKGNFKLRPEQVHLHELMLKVADRHGDYLKLELCAQSSLIQADRMHLTNVLSNLLENAVKYTPDNPAIWLVSRHEANHLVVSVQDNGIGIAREHLSHIFDAYYRAPGANSASVKGFGLGLNYVQQVAKAHRWKLDVASTPGQGSTFSIRIPLPVSPTDPESANRFRGFGSVLSLPRGTYPFFRTAQPSNVSVMGR